MITEAQLKEKIKAWIREYGPGGISFEKSTNLLQRLIDHKGFVPSRRGFITIPLATVADDVENAVIQMSAMPAEAGDENVLFKAAMALRVYYLTPKHWPEEERLRRLRAIGIPMSRFTFYRNVQLGRNFLMGWFNGSEHMKKIVA